MISKIKKSILLPFIMLSLQVLSQTNVEVLNNSSIINLHKAGLEPDVIISKIESSKCKFDVTTNGLVSLKKQGLPTDVIKAMMNKTDAKLPTTADKPSDKPSTSGGITTTKKSGTLQLDLLNYVYAYAKSNQSAKALEKAVAGIRTKQGMFGGSAMLQVDGGTSGIQLSESESASFVINTGSTALPELVLYKVKSVKNKREVASMKVNTFTGVKTGEDVISLNISKLSEGIFEVTPAKKLERGEYFFTAKPVAGATSVDAYTFGIK
jgi:hypothetical protein